MEQYAYMAENLTEVQEKEIRDLRNRFPNPISVEVARPTQGGFIADIKTLPGCFTEADSFSSLIEMINDAIRTYFEVPEKYAEFMPTYIPPLKEAQRLDVFPITERITEIKFEIADGAKVAH